MSSYKVAERNPKSQLRSAYTGNGGYQSSPDDNCSSIHLADPMNACSEASPTTVLQAFAALGGRSGA
jgi:hypothetical protein